MAGRCCISISKAKRSCLSGELSLKSATHLPLLSFSYSPSLQQESDPSFAFQTGPFVKGWPNPNPLTWAAPAAVCALNKHTHTSCRAQEENGQYLSSAQPVGCSNVCTSHLCIGVVGVPGRPERLLSSYIPHQEVCVLHHYFLHIASDGGRRMDHLVHKAAQKRITGWIFCEFQNSNWGGNSTV